MRATQERGQFLTETRVDDILKRARPGELAGEFGHTHEQYGARNVAHRRVPGAFEIRIHLRKQVERHCGIALHDVFDVCQ